MFLSRILLKQKPGWRPRSLGTPGRQWIGKNRRIRPVTACIRRSRREKEKRIAEVERMTEFSYLTAEESYDPGREEREEIEKNRLAWQKRTLGNDVFGLGLGKPSHLDHLLVNDTRRYNPPPET